MYRNLIQMKMDALERNEASPSAVAARLAGRLLIAKSTVKWFGSKDDATEPAKLAEQQTINSSALACRSRRFGKFANPR
jgi:hypothetical protein